MKTVTKVNMICVRATKNTYVFQCDADGTPVPTLYVGKHAFSSQPEKISVTVEVYENGD